MRLPQKAEDEDRIAPSVPSPSGGPDDVAAIGLRLAFFADPWGNLFEVIPSLSN